MTDIIANIRRATAAGLVLCAIGAPGAQAGSPPSSAPVKFVPADAQSREWPIISGVLGNYLSTHPKAKVQSGIADLTGQGVGSLFVRLDSPETCNADGCVTLGFHYGDNSWSAVFSRHLNSLAVGTTAKPGEAARPLIVNGREVWSWSPTDGYVGLADSVGRQIRTDENAPAQVRTAALAAIKNLTEGMTQDAAAKLEIKQKGVDLGGTKAILVSIRGGYVCGNWEGCPYVLLTQVGGRYAAVSSGSTDEPIVLLDGSSKGFRDLAVQHRQGYEILRYDGSSYVPAWTSWPSATTASP